MLKFPPLENCVPEIDEGVGLAPLLRLQSFVTTTEEYLAELKAFPSV